MTSPRVRPSLLLVGLLLLAVNLRIALAAYPPLLGAVRAALGVSSGVAGLVQACAVLAMGVASFQAGRVAAWLGWERALGASIGLLAAGCVLRVVPALPALVAGSLLVGLGIGGAGVLVAGVVKHHLARVAGTVTGAYAVCMMAGAGVTGVLAVPLAVGLGGWSFSLAVWAIPALLAVALWWPVARRCPRGTGGADVVPRLPWGDRFARLATVYLAMSSVQYYGWLTWVAPYYEHLGASPQKGAVLQSVWMVAQIPVALVVPALAERRRHWVFWAAATIVCGLLGILGALLAPTPPVVGPWLWMVLNAVGAATGFPLGLTVIAWRTPHAAGAGATTGMALGCGYLLAGVAPPLMGVLLDVTGGYQLPLALLVAAGVGQLVAAVLIGDRRRPSVDGAALRAAPPAS